jgi:hypothetical protein
MIVTSIYSAVGALEGLMEVDIADSGVGVAGNRL